MNLSNAARINLLRKQRTTGFSKNGVLAIDDTGSLKPYAKKTKSVAYQYCPSVKDIRLIAMLRLSAAM